MKTGKFLLILMLVLGIVGGVFAQSDDPDGDGLPNSVDECDNEAGPRSNMGCPVRDNNPTAPRATDIPPPDSDGDGTADPLDRCPNEFGDGANGGCPENSSTNTSSPAATPVQLLAAPTTVDCVVSSASTSPVNIREFPNVEADIVGVVSPNEWLEILGRFDYENVYFSQNGMGNGIPPLTILFDPDQAEYVVWYLVQDSDSPASGWVAAALLRFGGDCSEWVDVNPNVDGIFLDLKYADDDNPNGGFRGGVFVATGDVNGDGVVDAADYTVWRDNFGSSPVIPIFPNGNPFFAIPLEPLAAGYLKLDDIKGESREHENGEAWFDSESLPDGCELVEFGDGSVLPVCEDGSAPDSIVICTYQEVLEVGVFSEVCYEVEIPDGCVLENPEAGIWKISCDETVDNIQINPAGEPDPILDITWGEETVEIGLLLPAVQKVREAAAR